MFLMASALAAAGPSGFVTLDGSMREMISMPGNFLFRARIRAS